MDKHVIRFTANDAAVSIASCGPFLRDLLDVLVEGCQQATRLRVEGRSTAPGLIPSWLERAAAFELLGLEQGQSEIALGARPLEDAAFAKAWGAKKKTSADVDLSRSSLDLLEESLEDALSGQTDSDRYDRNLITTLETMGKLFHHGVDRIDLINGRTLRVDPPAMERLKHLRARIPGDRRVVLAGRLETIRHSDRAFALTLDSGKELRGVAIEVVEPSDLAALVGKPALVSAVAEFRPSGEVLRIEAERIDPAVGDLSVWSSIPRPLDLAIEQRALRVPQGPTSGVATILGRLRTEETEEEFLAAIEELS